MKKVNKKGQFEPIHAICILLCLLIAIVFFVLKRKLSNFNMQAANRQQNNFLLQAEERRRAKIEEERRKKQEEDRLNKEKENRLKNENILNEPKFSSLDLNNENPIKELNRYEDKNKETIRNLDTDYFSNKATSLHKSNIVKERIIEEKNETISFKNSVNMSSNNGNNGIVSSNKLETNENQNPSSSIVMKKIILLEPEIKTKKDDASLKSLDVSNDTKHKYIDLNKSNDYASGRDKIMKNQNLNTKQRESQKININMASNNQNNELLKNQKNNQELINKQSQASGSKANNPNKKSGKALHLNHVEKEMFFTALAIGNANNNFTRTQRLISVESLYEIKLSVDNKIEKDDENFNKEFSLMLKSTSSYEDYTKLIEKYSQSLKNQIIISRKNYAELVLNSLKYKEINHAIFFICEMDIRHYKIPRILLIEYFNNVYVVEMFREQILSNQKKQKYSESIYNDSGISSTPIILNNNPKYDINLICPENSDYKKNSEYYFFSSKKENYKVENLNNILTSLDLNIEKIKNFDSNKQEIKLDEENTGLNKFGLFNSVIEVNTNQNANPTNKSQGQPIQSTGSINTKDPIKKKKPKKKKVSIVPPESVKPNLQEKTTDSLPLSSSLNQGESNKTSQTIVQGNYTFYNPNQHPSHENRKLPSEIYYHKSIQSGFNNNRNYDGFNKNNYSHNYHNDNYNIQNNRGDNNQNYKMHQINYPNKAIQKTQNSTNSNIEKIHDIGNKNNSFINNDKYKPSYQHNDNRKTNESPKGEIMTNENFNPLSKLRAINIKEVKEFVPKNFVIINKESKN